MHSSFQKSVAIQISQILPIFSQDSEQIVAEMAVRATLAPDLSLGRLVKREAAVGLLQGHEDRDFPARLRHLRTREASLAGCPLGGCSSS